MVSQSPAPAQEPIRRLAVVGIGYVGIPVAALFAKAGLDVVGLDVDASKVAAINAGRYPIEGEEPGLPALISETVKAGRLRASTDPSVLADRDAIILCVQTPFDTVANEPNYAHLKSALQNVAEHMRRGALVVVESTIAPTTMERVVRPVLEAGRGWQAGTDFLLGNCPERVMPGKLLHNLATYDRVLGGVNAATHARMRELYSKVVHGTLDEADMLTAEVVKSFENTYRDVEIALANEFARYCDTLKIDFFRIRELVNRVESRNLHLAGAGVGGHCIPKDTYLLAYGTKGRFTPELMLKARTVNDAMPGYVADVVTVALQQAGRDPKGSRVAILGYSYLGDSDDIRNTPVEPLALKLKSSGCDVRIHDPFVRGVEAPVRVDSDLESVLHGADAVVVVTAHRQYRGIPLAQLRTKVRTPVLVDGRHVFERSDAEKAGFQFHGIGY